MTFLAEITTSLNFFEVMYKNTLACFFLDIVYT